MDAHVVEVGKKNGRMSEPRNKMVYHVNNGSFFQERADKCRYTALTI